MRHLQLVVDHEPVPTDFPPTWDEFQAARGRFLARLAAQADPAGDGDRAEAESPAGASRP